MDLMKKRYKVIADYPHSEHGIGDIFIETPHPLIFISTINGGHVARPDEYPAIFQPLPWFAERTAEEMPEYVKRNGVVCRAMKYMGTAYVITDEMYSVEAVANYQPATLAEYTEYLKASK